MNKSELIQKILDEVKTSLERDIPKNLNNFEIDYYKEGVFIVKSIDNKERRKKHDFEFNWYN